jgi:hypothetical protein
VNAVLLELSSAVATCSPTWTCAELKSTTMQPISSSGFTAHVVAAKDIKAVWQPKDITHRSGAQGRTVCWSPVVTIMPSLSLPQPLAWRSNETTMREEERLAYNRRIEVVRQAEYPMLRGKFVAWP